MRVITDDTREALAVFDRTHELAAAGLGVQWRMAWLPGPGCVAEQDGWLWEALRIVRAERTRELIGETTRDGGGGLDAWRARKVREMAG